MGTQKASRCRAARPRCDTSGKKERRCSSNDWTGRATSTVTQHEGKEGSPRCAAEGGGRPFSEKCRTGRHPRDTDRFTGGGRPGDVRFRRVGDRERRTDACTYMVGNGWPRGLGVITGPLCPPALSRRETKRAGGLAARRNVKGYRNGHPAPPKKRDPGSSFVPRPPSFSPSPFPSLAKIE